MTKLYVCQHCLELLKKQKNIRFEILKFNSKMRCDLCREEDPDRKQSQHVIEFDDRYLSLILHKTKFVNERSLRLIDQLEKGIDQLHEGMTRLNDMILVFGENFANHFFNTMMKRYAQEYGETEMKECIKQAQSKKLKTPPR